MMPVFEKKKRPTQEIIREGRRDYNSLKTAGNIGMMKKRHWSKKEAGGGVVQTCVGLLVAFFRLCAGSMVAKVCGQRAGVLGWPTGVGASYN